MAYSSSRSMSGLMNDYANLRTLPALLGISFALMSAYQFGAITELHFEWFEYTLTTEHAVFASLGSYALAFASSETRQLENYEGWEKAVIAAGPVLILGYQYTDFIADLLTSSSSNLAVMVAFGLTMASWGVAVR